MLRNPNAAGILNGDDFEIVYEANAGLASFRYAPPPPIRSYGQDSPMCPLVDEDEKVYYCIIDVFDLDYFVMVYVQLLREM